MKKITALIVSLILFSSLIFPTAVSGESGVSENILTSPLAVKQSLWLNPATDVTVSDSSIGITKTGIVTLKTEKDIPYPFTFEGEYTYGALGVVNIPILTAETDIYPHLAVKTGTDGKVYFGAQNNNIWYFTPSESTGITIAAGTIVGFKVEMDETTVKFYLTDRTLNPAAPLDTPVISYSLADLAVDLKSGAQSIGAATLSGWKPAAGFYVENNTPITAGNLKLMVKAGDTPPPPPPPVDETAKFTKNILTAPIGVSRSLWLDPKNDVILTADTVAVNKTGMAVLRTDAPLTAPFLFEGEYTYNTVTTVNIPVLAGSADLYPHLAVKNGSDGRVYFGAQNDGKWYFTASVSSGITFAAGQKIGFRVIVDNDRIKYYIADRTANPDAPFGAAVLDYALSDLGNDLKTGAESIGLPVLTGFQPVAGFYMEDNGSITAGKLKVLIPESAGLTEDKKPISYRDVLRYPLKVSRFTWGADFGNVSLDDDILTIDRLNGRAIFVGLETTRAIQNQTRMRWGGIITPLETKKDLAFTNLFFMGQKNAENSQKFADHTLSIRLSFSDAVNPNSASVNLNNEGWKDDLAVSGTTLNTFAFAKGTPAHFRLDMDGAKVKLYLSNTEITDADPPVLDFEITDKRVLSQMGPCVGFGAEQAKVAYSKLYVGIASGLPGTGDNTAIEVPLAAFAFSIIGLGLTLAAKKEIRHEE